MSIFGSINSKEDFDLLAKDLRSDLAACFAHDGDEGDVSSHQGDIDILEKFSQLQIDLIRILLARPLTELIQIESSRVVGHGHRLIYGVGQQANLEPRRHLKKVK